MPCVSDYLRDAGNEEDRKELDRVTRLLCAICKRLDAGRDVVLTSEMRRWWKRHKRADEERRK